MIFICLISLVLSIILLILFGIKKKALYWNLFFGIIISRLASIYPILFYISFDDSIDLGGAIAVNIILALTFINSIILLIIGLIIKSKIKKNNSIIITTNIIFPVTMFIYFLICIVVIVLIPKIEINNSNKSISNNVLSYFETKYGDKSIKVKSVEKDYSYNGFTQKYHTGYEVYISSDYINGTIEIDTDLDGNVEDEMFSCYICEYYYKKYGYEYDKKTYNYKSSDSPILINLSIYEYEIPSNYGRIPTFDEIIEYDALDCFDIYLPEDESNKYKYSIDDRINYIGIIIEDLIKEFNISKDIEFEFVGRGLFRYHVKREGDILTIIGDDDFTDNDKTNIKYIYDIKNKKIISKENILDD